jgi:putative flippase GtrA
MLRTQLIRFAVIGCTAMGIHWSTVVLLVQRWDLPPLIANILGFLLAFQISYLGHYRWTFKATHLSHKTTSVRFFATACLGFFLSESFYALALYMTPLPYELSLIIVLFLISTSTFVLSKFWAFS